MVMESSVGKADILTNKETGESFAGTIGKARIGDTTLVVRSDGTRLYINLDHYDIAVETHAEETNTGKADDGQTEKPKDMVGGGVLELEQEGHGVAAPEEEAQLPTGTSASEDSSASAPEGEPADDTREDVIDGEDGGAGRVYSAGDTVEIDLGNDVSMTLAYVPPGRFAMGSPVDEEHRDDDEKQHVVRISRPFFIGTTEVTRSQYIAIMGNTPNDKFEGEDRPVVFVNWSLGKALCEKLTEKTGDVFRLPTEAEWEYAARAGRRGPYGGTGRLEDMGWTGSPRGGPRPVAQKLPNAAGLYDMHGNVWEWCSDWYAEYPDGPVADPKGPSEGKNHVLRGGSWWSEGTELGGCRSANRLNPTFTGRWDVGFRVVREVKLPLRSEDP